MSEQSPDLHAIFGIDEDTAEHVAIGVDNGRGGMDNGRGGMDNGLGGGGERAVSVASSIDLAPPDIPPQDLDPGPSPAAQEEQAESQRTGLTKPSRRGSSSRFLTDVVIEMGLVARPRVEEAIESSRSTGTTPERVLLTAGALTTDGLARALAERYGLDHLDLSVFSVDMGAANLVTTTAAKRYQAVPVAFIDKRTLLVAMTDPSNVLAVDDIAIMTGYEVRVGVAAP